MTLADTYDLVLIFNSLHLYVTDIVAKLIALLTSCHAMPRNIGDSRPDVGAKNLVGYMNIR